MNIYLVPMRCGLKQNPNAKANSNVESPQDRNYEKCDVTDDIKIIFKNKFVSFIQPSSAKLFKVPTSLFLSFR